jgi:hypothetical protein
MMARPHRRLVRIPHCGCTVVIAGLLWPLQAGAGLKIGDIELSVGCG